MERAKLSDALQDHVFNLFLAIRAGKPRNQTQAVIDGLLARQRPDGGWNQLPTLTSDAFAAALGRSPWSVMLSPLRVTDSGANDNAGLADAFDGPAGALNVGNAPVGPFASDRFRFTSL